MLDDRAVFDASPYALAVVSLDGRLLDANPACLELLGLTDESFGSLDALSLIHPDDRARTSDDMSRLMSGELAEYQTEKRYVRPDGGQFTGHVVARCLRSTDGQPTALLKTIRECTAPEQHERVRRNLAAASAVSELAAHSAHELNNVIADIVMRLDVAESVSSSIGVVELVAGIRSSLDRAIGLGRHLVALSDDRVVAAPHQRTDRGSGRRILVVDDEPQLLESMVQVLRHAGFDVVGVSTGTEALHHVVDPGIGLVITDLLMPDLDGAALAARVGVTRPDLPLLLTTGYAGRDLADRVPADASLLRKPFRAQELVTTVQRVLADLDPATERYPDE